MGVTVICYLLSSRITPDGDFGRLHLPPRYAAPQKPSSPRFSRSSIKNIDRSEWMSDLQHYASTSSTFVKVEIVDISFGGASST